MGRAAGVNPFEAPAIDEGGPASAAPVGEPFARAQWIVSRHLLGDAFTVADEHRRPMLWVVEPQRFFVIADVPMVFGSLTLLYAFGWGALAAMLVAPWAGALVGFLFSAGGSALWLCRPLRRFEFRVRGKGGPTVMWCVQRRRGGQWLDVFDVDGIRFGQLRCDRRGFWRRRHCDVHDADAQPLGMCRCEKSLASSFRLGGSGLQWHWLEPGGSGVVASATVRRGLLEAHDGRIHGELSRDENRTTWPLFVAALAVVRQWPQ